MSQSQLDEFRREVNLALAVGAFGDLELPATSDDGGHPVVVALEDESLSVVLDRLGAVGGRATLFVRGPHDMGIVSVAGMSRAERP
ncbi:hypothetical protein IU448_15160 [Nocardia flavorosea]|uniref:hypothetical protein n=1 Tax=Nocardia flavorosea TaxID=53429 RepID=UPI001892D486|nr:hypothetical protein [Nocardia flavorosea]MBF6350345.1 hypothetical protein [Nocardia flavorosea]